MSLDLTDEEEPAIVAAPSSGDLDVVTISPLVRKSLLAAVAVLGGVLLITLVASLLSGDAEQPVVDDVSLLVTSTTSEDVPPTSDAAAPAPTTTQAPVTTTTVAVVPAAAFAESPTETELVLWTFNEQRVVLVDVDAATAIEVDMRDLGVPLVERIIGAGEVLVVQSLGDYYAVRVRGDRTLLNVRGVVQAFGDDEVWATDVFVGDRPATPFRIDFDGERTQLPQLPAETFPFGWFDDRLIVGGGGSGGIYIEAGDGYQRVADGELVASRNGFVLSRVCDETLHCAIARIDLRSGATTLHEIPQGFAIGALWWLDDPNSPTLDAILGVSNELGSPALWDLLADEVTPLAIGQGRGATFSTNGLWVFVSVGDDVIAFNRENGIEVVVPIGVSIESPNGLQLAALSNG